MKETDKKAWIEALRSGEYTQGKRALCRRDGSFCCLGVAYDVLVDGWWEQYEGGGWAADENLGILSESITKQIGLHRDWMYRLTAINDSTLNGLTFEQIANGLEAIHGIELGRPTTPALIDKFLGAAKA